MRDRALAPALAVACTPSAASLAPAPALAVAVVFAPALASAIDDAPAFALVPALAFALARNYCALRVFGASKSVFRASPQCAFRIRGCLIKGGSDSTKCRGTFARFATFAASRRRRRSRRSWPFAFACWEGFFEGSFKGSHFATFEQHASC